MSTFEQLSSKFESLFTDLDPNFAIKYFKKKTYLSFLETYEEKHRDVYELICAYVREDENWKAGIRELADLVSQNAKKAVAKTWFFQRAREEMDRTCMVTFYMIPALLDLSIPEKEEIAEIIADSWSDTFGSNRLTAADKNTIQSGFVTKIFGVPIHND